MTSEKQIKANILNSVTAGVKTESGKAKVRHNSYKHGLTGKSILSGFKTIGESEEQFNELLSNLESSFGPQNSHEQSLIALMASALWKLKRFDLLESSLWFEISSDARLMFTTRDYPDDDVLSISNLGKMALALKYKASMEAQYYRALSSLLQGRQLNTQMDLFLKNEESCDQT